MRKRSLATTIRRGRLSITFPRSVGQLPDYYNSDPSRIHKYVDDDGKPLFQFGFGLSYNAFRYDHLARCRRRVPGSHGDIQVTVDVTNTGDREGDEVAQLYLRQDVGSVETPERALKGFSRIHLKPGEAKAVTFHVPEEQTRSVERREEWAVEAGGYTVWVGGSSQATLTTKFNLKF